MVVSIPDPAAIGHDSRDGSKIIRRTISGSEREIFCRIRWTGERRTSSSLSGNDRVFVRGVTTGVLGTPVILAFVLMIVRRYRHPENINPAMGGKTWFPEKSKPEILVSTHPLLPISMQN